jgi:hypothetical protein
LTTQSIGNRRLGKGLVDNHATPKGSGANICSLCLKSLKDLSRLDATDQAESR